MQVSRLAGLAIPPPSLPPVFPLLSEPPNSLILIPPLAGLRIPFPAGFTFPGQPYAPTLTSLQMALEHHQAMAAKMAEQRNAVTAAQSASAAAPKPHAAAEIAAASASGQAAASVPSLGPPQLPTAFSNPPQPPPAGSSLNPPLPASQAPPQQPATAGDAAPEGSGNIPPPAKRRRKSAPKQASATGQEALLRDTGYPESDGTKDDSPSAKKARTGPNARAGSSDEGIAPTLDIEEESMMVDPRLMFSAGAPSPAGSGPARTFGWQRRASLISVRHEKDGRYTAHQVSEIFP